MRLDQIIHPLAIAMWDFSWLERRWPGAGYEDWDLALDELAERGYDAVRIDAYPHFIAQDPQKEWTIVPCWTTNDWGSPARNTVVVQPALNTFIRKCRNRGIRVGLSSWYQSDPDLVNHAVPTAECHADIWKRTLDSIAEEDLLDAILYVDLCNEWPFKVWAPFFNTDNNIAFTDPASLAWMKTAIEMLRTFYPDLSYTFSHVGLLNRPEFTGAELSFFNLLEPHVWMVHANRDEFYRRVGYQYERFDGKGYENVVRHAERLYRSAPDYWDGLLRGWIDQVAAESRQYRQPLITTECWSIVDYKDWPLLDWEWVKESCAAGVRHAVSTGRWLAMGTSNFCGPQFTGMWRDIEWHREMTHAIKTAALPQGDRSGRA